MNKVYTAFYDENTSCQCHPEYDTRFRVIVAATEAQALGFVLETESDTQGRDWSIYEVDTITPKVVDESAYILREF